MLLWPYPRRTIGTQKQDEKTMYKLQHYRLRQKITIHSFTTSPSLNYKKLHHKQEKLLDMLLTCLTPAFCSSGSTFHRLVMHVSSIDRAKNLVLESWDSCRMVPTTRHDSGLALS